MAKYNQKYNKKIVERICELMSVDSYTVAEICEMVKISERAYYEWQAKYADFADAIKRAQDKFDELLIVEAKKSLVKMVQGYSVDETRTVTADTGKKDHNGKAIVRVKEHVVTKKHYQPNPTLIIFTLTNRDPDNWKNRQENKLSGEVGIKSNLENLSNEDLQKIIDGKAE